MGDIPKDNTIIAVADSPKKLAIIEVASKGEIIFDHANKMIIQLNELQKVYQQIIDTQKRLFSFHMRRILHSVEKTLIVYW